MIDCCFMFRLKPGISIQATVKAILEIALTSKQSKHKIYHFLFQYEAYLIMLPSDEPITLRQILK